MKNSWVVNGNLWYKQEVSSFCDTLKGVYMVHYDERNDRIYLEHIYDNFDFDYKLYGLEASFIDRCIKSYSNTTGNMGVLMNGVKGSGKSVSSKILANKLELPVILVTTKIEGLPTFINTIQQDLVLFFDEYDKIYDKYDAAILTVMDGVLSTEYRRFFLLTSNDVYLNENMLQRPSRIRYIKQFNDLPMDIIEEIVDDCLKYPEFKEDIIAFIKTLEIITVDLVKAVISEVNIHNESPDNFKDVFNINSMNSKFFNVYVIDVNDNTEYLFKTGVKVSPAFGLNAVGKYLYIGGEYYGSIKKMHGSDIIVTDFDSNDEPDDSLIKQHRKDDTTVIFKIVETVSMNRMFDFVL